MPLHGERWTITLEVTATNVTRTIHAIVKNESTGATRHYDRDIRDYSRHYAHMTTPNPSGHSADDLAWGETVSTLFADILDSFENV